MNSNKILYSNLFTYHQLLNRGTGFYKIDSGTANFLYRNFNFFSRNSALINNQTGGIKNVSTCFRTTHFFLRFFISVLPMSLKLYCIIFLIVISGQLNRSGQS